jgi:hypothetical protein
MRRGIETTEAADRVEGLVADMKAKMRASITPNYELRDGVLVQRPISEWLIEGY